MSTATLEQAETRKKTPKCVPVVTTAKLFAAGCAKFTLQGCGRSWTFRIDKSIGDNGRAMFFVSLLVGPDNTSDFCYMGMYFPDGGWMRLTKASKFTETCEPVRGFRWMAGLVANGREDEIGAKGFRIVWSSECQRCGRELTVPSSVDSRLGPECAKHFSGN